MNTFLPKDVIAQYQSAKDRRSAWEGVWQDCYDFALPSRDSAVRGDSLGPRRGDRLFDGTAPDAVDQLAASIMSQLTPPGGRWFGFSVGPDVVASDRAELGAALERATAIMQSHIERSNFAVEMHQCYLDLVTAGTACLLFEEAPPGEPSAFRFTAVPLAHAVLDEGAGGRLDVTYRRCELTPAQLSARFQLSVEAERILGSKDRRSDQRLAVIEAVIPDGNGYRYVAVAETHTDRDGEPLILAQGRFASSPFINFRWLKAPGEIYGRSPVMKALPDIRTANKVVELVLKNASIAVTGIWQADDDGVINPATIKLIPGTIIPKAVGSAGLTPLQAPGRFDVSELVLNQLRERIRKALFVEQLGQINGPRMTATEVLQRAAEIARILGAAYGRLQSELMAPLVSRARSILARRGEIEDFPLDHRFVALDYRSPQARFQAQLDVQNTLMWLDSVRNLGPEGLAAIDPQATARWLGTSLGVPVELMREAPATEVAGAPAPGLAAFAASVDPTAAPATAGITAEAVLATFLRQLTAPGTRGSR